MFQTIDIFSIQPNSILVDTFDIFIFSFLCLFRILTKESNLVEKDIDMNENCVRQLNVDLENLRSIQEEKEETLRVMTRAVHEEDKKLERAKVSRVIFMETHKDQMVVYN